MSDKITLLVVDDDVDFLESLVSLLEYKNYSVTTAVDGKEAISKYPIETPDFVLMDINMPNVDGYDAFFKIKEIDSNAKIILMSGYGVTERYAKAKSQCLIYCVPKPFSSSFLDELIQQNVERDCVSNVEIPSA